MRKLWNFFSPVIYPMVIVTMAVMMLASNQEQKKLANAYNLELTEEIFVGANMAFEYGKQHAFECLQVDMHTNAIEDGIQTIVTVRFMETATNVFTFEKCSNDIKSVFFPTGPGRLSTR